MISLLIVSFLVTFLISKSNLVCIVQTDGISKSLAKSTPNLPIVNGE